VLCECPSPYLPRDLRKKHSPTPYLPRQAKQRSAPPPKTRACLSQAPTKRGVRASLQAALLPVDATHVATVPSTPAAISAKPPAVARPTGV
jgi:hypothetical protein